MRKSVLVWLILSIAGVVTIALPDFGPRLFSFSSAHGPSLVDGIGIALLLIGWMFFIAPIWKRRKTLRLISGTTVMNIGLFAGGMSAGLIVASVMSDIDYWWVIGTLSLTCLQLLLVWFVWRKGKA